MAHLNRGCCVEAVQVLSQAAELLKDDADVWAHLGVALVGIDQSLKARSCFERSLALAPNRPLIWNNLGVLLLHAGEAERAHNAFHRAFTLHPEWMPARQNAALSLYALGRDGEAEALLPSSSGRFVLQGQALKEAGDLEGATEAFRKAILRLEEEGIPTPESTPQSSTRDRARKALLAAKERLDGAGIAFYLFAGTLLGVVRDGDLLANDKDLDLGVPWEVDRSRVVEALCAGGAFTVPWVQGSLPSDRPWYRSFKHAESDFSLDIFFLKPEGSSILCGSDNRPSPILCRLKSFGPREWSWRGQSWKVPDPPEQYLTEIYGPDWQVPDPHYDTVLSNPTRTPESIPEVLCMSYFRLIEALAEGKVVRAKALIEQIILRKEDPFLTDLQIRLDGPAFNIRIHGGSK
ncbi:MAG: tetratricopeptide repeat protein [Holophagaceae bacterium]|nr:tetratricopeptide repeat protein [Holophagaceae bacterium]